MVAYSNDTVGVNNKSENTNVIELFDAPIASTSRAQGDRANPDDGLQGQTCYSPKGDLGVDQAFDADKFAEGVLYMPEFDVCAKVSSVDAGRLSIWLNVMAVMLRALYSQVKGRSFPALATEI